MLDVPFRSTAAETFATAELSSPETGSIWKLSRRREALLVIAFMGLQMAILLMMMVLDGLPLLLGEHLLLKVVPVDPRDLMRGDYVVLDYGFNRLGQRQDPATGNDWYDWNVAGRDVYVSLDREGDHFIAASASLAPPASGPYIRGKVTYPGHIECGIEAYYVQEGEGLRLQQAIRRGNILAEVAVWHGQAKLVRLVE